LAVENRRHGGFSLVVERLRGMVAPMKCVLLLLGLISAVQASPLVVDDVKLIRQLQVELGKEAEKEDAVTGADLAEAVKDVPKTCAVDIIGEGPSGNDHANLSKSVFVLSSVYKCGKCDKWHVGGAATAWCLSADGIMVTNFHVFEGAKGGAYGIGSRDGTVWPVVEILAADRATDTAVFRVKGEGFQPLVLGGAAEVGDKVRVISHPNRKFFLQTSGEVARYHMHRSQKAKKGSVMMSVTADYAKGSSGGPVLDEKGEVVGMVSSTQSIYYGKDDEGDQENLQMVVKNTVPVDAVRAALKGE
jgi:serine protease Do